MSKKTDKISEDDTDLFRRQMQGVKPLTPDNKIEPEHKRLNPKARHEDLPSHADSAFIQSDYVDHVEPEQTLSFARGGPQHKTLKRLRQGQFTIEDRLDLHGFTIDEAAQALQAFIEHASVNDLRHVIIIHGRGHRSQDNKPVIKAHINHWLRQLDAVLAFHSALPKHGGVGAVYVLLKNMNKA
jgi:DNA-nicking Smr family endonuclease